MRSVELVERYLEIIFSGKDLDTLEKIFVPDLQFSGPWFQFDSSTDYISSLKERPFEEARYKIIRSYGDNDSACVVYKMSAHGLVDIPMSVFARICDDKIVSILLIFDTAVLREKLERSQSAGGYTDL